MPSWRPATGPSLAVWSPTSRRARPRTRLPRTSADAAPVRSPGGGVDPGPGRGRLRRDGRAHADHHRAGAARPSRPRRRNQRRHHRPGPRRHPRRRPARRSCRPSPPACRRWRWSASSLSLDAPLNVQHAGDGSGRLFIVEKIGRIRIAQWRWATGRAVPRHHRQGGRARGRARAARPRVPSQVRDQRPVLRQLHRPSMATP